MKKLFVVLLALSLVGGFSAALYAGIAGSVHDFSSEGFSGGRICIVCHAPHNADTSVTDAPLWNHEVTTATYTIYSSPSFDGSTTIGQPSGSSKLCLSCHDGTVAVDSFGGATGTDYISGPANIGTDLSDDHPISFVYDTALATADGALGDPSTAIVTVGSGSFTQTGTIQDVLLLADKLECAACHAVHNDFVVGGIGGDPLLKISKLGSELCFACHVK